VSQDAAALFFCPPQPVQALRSTAKYIPFRAKTRKKSQRRTHFGPSAEPFRTARTQLIYQTAHFLLY